MFWFYSPRLSVFVKLYLFKYILCFGSTALPSLLHPQPSNLNTSYVLVLHFVDGDMRYIKINLNTSYVLVLQTRIRIFFLSSHYLNTSYVLVLPLGHIYPYRLFHPFKYILCFGSTLKSLWQNYALKQFKYILCFGSTHAQFGLCLSYLLFKYILCFGST